MESQVTGKRENYTFPTVSGPFWENRRESPGPGQAEKLERKEKGGGRISYKKKKTKQAATVGGGGRVGRGGVMRKKRVKQRLDAFKHHFTNLRGRRGIGHVRPGDQRWSGRVEGRGQGSKGALIGSGVWVSDRGVQERKKARARVDKRPQRGGFGGGGGPVRSKEHNG